MDSTRIWVIVAVVFLLTGLPPLLSIFFPRIGAGEWRNIKGVRYPGYKMSLAGKLVAGMLPLLLICWFLSARGKLGWSELAIAIPLTIVAVAVIAYDVRRTAKPKS